MRREKVLMQDVLKTIEQADDLQMADILKAVMQRYALVFPDWEVKFLSFHKDPQIRKEEIKATIQWLRKYDKERPPGWEVFYVTD